MGADAVRAHPSRRRRRRSSRWAFARGGTTRPCGSRCARSTPRRIARSSKACGRSRRVTCSWPTRAACASRAIGISISRAPKKNATSRRKSSSPRSTKRCRFVSAAITARVACALSGGLDSSTVTALAARRRAVQCFTLSFEGSSDYDEASIAERTAKRLGVELDVVRASRARCGTRSPRRSRRARGSRSTCTSPPSGCSRARCAAAGHSVLLTGEGADEVLAGYAHFRRDLLVESGDASGRPRGAERRVGRAHDARG